MTTWISALAFVAACSGIGVFVDFLIGKQGQKKVREHFERWCLRLSGVHFQSFGGAEARFASVILTRWFGSFFSMRRVVSIFFLSAAMIMLWALILIFTSNDGGAEKNAYFGYSVTYMAELFIGRVFVLSFSISVLLLSLNLTAKLLVGRAWVNFLFFLISIALQIVLLSRLLIAGHLTGGIFFNIINDFRISADHHIQANNLWDEFMNEMKYAAIFDHIMFYNAAGDWSWQAALDFLFQSYRYFPSVLRISLLFIFFLSVVFNPIQRLVLLLAQRVSESDKPIFTVFFGGIGAIAKTIQAMMT